MSAMFLIELMEQGLEENGWRVTRKTIEHTDEGMIYVRLEARDPDDHDRHTEMSVWYPEEA